ncbi:hypothetical protein [Xanthomonas arboricola]
MKKRIFQEQIVYILREGKAGVAIEVLTWLRKQAHRAGAER